MSRRICKKCDPPVNFATLTLKKSHDEEVHGVKMYHCTKFNDDGSKCTFMCPKKYNLPLHEKKHNPKPENIHKYKCDHDGCDKEFVSISSLNNHRKKHDEDYEAPVCTIEGCTYSKPFSSKDSLLRHLWDQHNVTHEDYVCEEFKCEHCEKVFHRKDKYERHILMKHDIGVIVPHPCMECDVVVSSKAALIKHINEQHNDNVKMYKCSECDYNTKRNDDLILHLWRKHRIGDGKIYVCNKESCDFTTTYKHNYDQHMWCIHGEGKGKDFNCPECFYSSKRPHNYKNHIGTMHDIGDKICDYCLGNRFLLRKYKDKNNGNVNICRNCYRKESKTVFSRAEEQMVKAICEVPGLKEYVILQNQVLKNDKCNTKRRPDLLLSSGDLHIFNECDENQHKWYLPECEWGRMDELIDEMPEGKIVFIRWNPDAYKTPDNKKKLNRTERLNVLVRTIKDICCNNIKLTEYITIIYMFYNKDNPVICDRWKKIFIYE